MDVHHELLNLHYIELPQFFYHCFILISAQQSFIPKFGTQTQPKRNKIQVLDLFHYLLMEIY